MRSGGSSEGVYLTGGTPKVCEQVFRDVRHRDRAWWWSLDGRTLGRCTRAIAAVLRLRMRPHAGYPNHPDAYFRFLDRVAAGLDDKGGDIPHGSPGRTTVEPPAEWAHLRVLCDEPQGLNGHTMTDLLHFRLGSPTEFACHDDGPAVADAMRAAFGNPFRPIGYYLDGGPNAGWCDQVDPGWLNEDVCRLVEEAHAEAKVTADGFLSGFVPSVLADALEDAGCDCDQVLMPLRGARPAVAWGCGCDGAAYADRRRGGPSAIDEAKARCVCAGLSAWTGPVRRLFVGAHVTELLRKGVERVRAAQACRGG